MSNSATYSSSDRNCRMSLSARLSARYEALPRHASMALCCTAAEARQVLGQHRIALVRHRGTALLSFGEEFLGLAHIGALQVADLGGEVLDRVGDDRKCCEERGVPVARDHLGGDRLDA